MTTECESEEGITIGIIDTIITMVALLKRRDLTHSETHKALLDLRVNALPLVCDGVVFVYDEDYPCKAGRVCFEPHVDTVYVELAEVERENSPARKRRAG